jgi:hypothetical protein
MIHMIKLCVGITDIAHLAKVQAERAQSGQALRHRTRNFPKRRDELCDGGSLYWVIAGAILVRQRILDVIEDRWEDDSRCAGIMLDAGLVPVVGRPTKPFQGWRYLAPEAAPPDLVGLAKAEGEDELPEKMRAEFRFLGLL